MLCDTDKFPGRVVTDFCGCGHMIIAHSDGGLCAPCAMVETTVCRVMPGDVIVYSTEKRLTMDNALNIQRTLRELFPDNKIGVMDESGKVAIVRPEE